jgi:hypothetical protein
LLHGWVVYDNDACDPAGQGSALAAGPHRLVFSPVIHDGVNSSVDRSVIVNNDNLGVPAKPVVQSPPE